MSHFKKTKSPPRVKYIPNPNPLTNQELLSELEKRLPFFTQDEVVILAKLTMTNLPYNCEKNSLKKLEEINPQFRDLAQRAIQEAKKEKVDEQVAEIKKALGYKEKEEPNSSTK